jgi:flagellar protein FlaJ
MNVFLIEGFERNISLFWFIAGISVVVGIFPFVFLVMVQTEGEKEKEEMFLEFSRNLVESVRSGTPISRSILNVRNKDYGSLTPHINKLGNQIALGIPVKDALRTFSLDINSPVISRAIDLITEAEKAGGDTEAILESVAKSVSEIEDLKKQRVAAISNLIVQGYIIFIIFIIIMLVMEFKILPIVTGITLGMEGSYISGGIGTSFTKVSPQQLSLPFFILLLVQGLFAGLIIGKIAEGNVRAGIKHSFILTVLAVLISTGARVFFG